MDFDWDTGNVHHLQLHGLVPAEVVEVFFGPIVMLKEQEIGGEARTVIVGETSAKLVLVVVFTIRQGKVRVVTAFPAKRKLRRMYQEALNAP